MQIEPLYERLLEFASAVPGSTEIIQARIKYFAALGRLSEFEPAFERHLTNFLDWYVFERPLDNSGVTPAELFLSRGGAELSAEERAAFEGFTRTRRSLFQVLRSDDSGVLLRDLLEGVKVRVLDERPRGFARKEIFQGRLIPVGQELYLSEALIFHPLRANRYLRRRARALRKLDAQAKQRLLQELAHKRLQADRYKHVDVLYFYR